MRTLSLALCMLTCFSSGAQHSVTLRVRALPSYHNSTDPLYIAGSFNNWNAGNPAFRFEKDLQGAYFITLAAPKGKHEFKITRGSWEKVESGDGGFPVANRLIEVLGDTLIEISIGHWADHFPQQPKKSTASARVRIIETSFFMPQLNRYRRVWVYLPPGYEASRKKYPVLYLHDGQNVFGDTTSFSGEWGVDEAMDTLDPSYRAAIIVAVDHGGSKRTNEYAPFDMEKYGKGEGAAYVDFLVNTLRPYIKKNYRVRSCGKHHYLAGSSMGGLISYYALLRYPKKFGGAGVFSPAFWINPQLRAEAEAKAGKIRGRVYFFAGMLEGQQMVSDMLTYLEITDRKSKAKITSVIRAEGKHNEATWRAEFPAFYKWLVK